MASEDKLAALEHLGRLKANGVITEAEFAAEKAAVLAGRTMQAAAPTQHVDMPYALPAAPPTIIYAQPPKRRGCFAQALVYGVIGLTIGLIIEVPRYLHTGSLPSAFNGTIPACDSSEAKDTLKDAMEHGPDEKTVNTQVLDIIKPQEVVWDAGNQSRSCSATVTLNSGTALVSYRMYLNSDKTNFILRVSDVSRINPLFDN